MSHRRSIRGDGGVSLLLAGAFVVALFGWLAPKVAPSAFDKRTREANQSQAASAEVEKRVAAAVEAEQAKGAVVAASVQQIGVAAGQLPESPQKTFIVRESGWAAPLLPPPDPAALLAAERRRVAILEGKLELTEKLYLQGTADNATLLARAAKAEAKLSAAYAARRDADADLAESAAYARGKDAVIGCLAAIAVLCGLGWVYAKLNGFSAKTLGQMITDLRAGESAEAVFDRYVPVRLQREVRHAASDAAS